MLSRKNRISLDRDFKRIFRVGKKASGSFFFIKTLKNNLNYPRISIVIGKNIAKKAVKRNKIRRLLNRIIEKKLPRLDKNSDIVVIFQKNPFILEKTKKELESLLEEEVKKAFVRLKLLK